MSPVVRRAALLAALALGSAALAVPAAAQCELGKTSLPPGPFPILDTHQLGKGVAVHGEHLLVGAPRKNTSASDAGQARLHARTPDGWQLVQTVDEPFGTQTGLFGWEVALDGHRALVGALHDDSAGNSAGAVHVFDLVDGQLVPREVLVGSDTDASDEFSRGLSLHRERLVVGAPLHDSQVEYGGAVYVFEWSGDGFVETARLVADDAAAGDLFGWTVAQTDDVLVVGAPGLWEGPGKVYVHVLRAGSWELLDVLQPDGLPEGARFGDHVAVEGDLIAVGAPQDGPLPFNTSGTVRIYEIAGDHVALRQRLQAGTAHDTPFFGRRVLLHEGTLCVGAPGWPTVADDPGHVHVFEELHGAWHELAELRADDASPADGYGVDLATDGERLFVGADRARLPIDPPLVGGLDASVVGAVYEVAGALDLEHWSDAGGALAGPCLAGGGVPAPAAALRLDLVGAPAAAPATFVFGLSEVSLPFAGGVLVPAPDAVFAGPDTSASGALGLPWRWPPALPAGTDLWLQAWLPDPDGPAGWSASNALRVTGAP